jgi:hypothetical protein
VARHSIAWERPRRDVHFEFARLDYAAEWSLLAVCQEPIEITLGRDPTELVANPICHYRFRVSDYEVRRTGSPMWGAEALMFERMRAEWPEPSEDQRILMLSYGRLWSRMFRSELPESIVRHLLGLGLPVIARDAHVASERFRQLGRALADTQHTIRRAMAVPTEYLLRDSEAIDRPKPLAPPSRGLPIYKPR